MEYLRQKELYGEYEIDSLNITTGERVYKRKGNLILQGMFSSIFSLLNYDAETPSADIINLDYIAIGDGEDSVSRSDTVLDNEIFRKVFVSKSYTNTVFSAKAIIGATEGNPTGGVINEVGVVSGGSTSADTGLLLSRALVGITKNSNIQLQITWRLTTI